MLYAKQNLVVFPPDKIEVMFLKQTSRQLYILVDICNLGTTVFFEFHSKAQEASR